MGTPGSEGTSPDVMILGGGVIGLSVALHLLDRQPSARVVIADTPNRPGVASQAAAGMLAPLAEFDEDCPLFRLCLDSWNYYRKFLARLVPDAPPLDATGILIPAMGAGRSRAERIAQFAAGFGDVEWLGREQVLAREPALADGRCEEALAIPGGLINPRLLHGAMRAAVGDRGAMLFDNAITRIDKDEASGCIARVHLDDGSVYTPGLAVLASGSWSPELARLLGIDLAVRPIKGQVCRIGAPEGFLRHVVHEHGIYLAPRAGQGIIIGATMEDVGFDGATTSASTTSDLLHAAMELAPTLGNYPVLDAWSGYRPSIGDGMPLLGWSNTVPNLLLATGHHRNGILLTPISGRIIADAIGARPSTLPYVYTK